MVLLDMTQHCILQNDCDANTMCEVTSEMLEQEYMKYLHWAYVDISSEKACAAEIKEMQVWLYYCCYYYYWENVDVQGNSCAYCFTWMMTLL